MSDSEKEYATVQIRKPVKDQIVQYCNQNNLKIGRFVESLFAGMMSGSNGGNVNDR